VGQTWSLCFFIFYACLVANGGMEDDGIGGVRKREDAKGKGGEDAKGKGRGDNIQCLLDDIEWSMIWESRR